MLIEVSSGGCSYVEGTCPIWLMENLQYYNVTNDKYSINNNSETYQNIKGYWLLSSLNGVDNAYRIGYSGRETYGQISTGNFGVRPVITVSIDDLSS